MKFCNRCGYRMEDNDRFCFNCGAPYSEPQVQTPQPVSTPQPGPVQVPAQGFYLKEQEPFEAAGAKEPTVIPGPTVFLNEKEDAQEEDGEVTGELNPAVNKKIYGVFKYNDNGSDKEFKMEDDIVLIGRDASNCDLVISTDRFVGRSHALIYAKAGKFYAVDLNSKNGTFINGQRITGLIKLDGECVIKVASTEIKFYPV